MLTVKQCREILGKEYEKETDEMIIEIRDFLSMMADIAIDNIERKELENKKDNTPILEHKSIKC
jgi:hypothetical protein